MDLLFDGEEYIEKDAVMQLFSLLDYDAQKLCNTLPKGSAAREVFMHRVNSTASQYVLLQKQHICTIYTEIWNSDLRWRKSTAASMP